MNSKQIQISEYLNSGAPQKKHFKLVSVELPKIASNQVLVKNLWMTVDPYMRGRMMNVKSYIPPFKLNEPLEGEALGIVESSQHPDFVAGDLVRSFFGWREYFVAEGNAIEKLTAEKSSLPHWLSVLGMPGLTAYGGLLSIGKLKEGETVFVSAASGAVGSVVCQIAKLKKCKVIASAGGSEKNNWLRDELDVDFSINYKECPNIADALQRVAPDGIDVYFDNVGGEHLQAAISCMKDHGRIILCGMISQYNAEKLEPGPNNLLQVVFKRLTIQGFIVTEFDSIKAQFQRDMTQWIKQGKIKAKETIMQGIENAPDAFISLFSGNHLGKMLVKLAE